MKPFILILIASVFISAPLQAMQPESDTGPDLSQIITELNLDADQATRLTGLVKQHHEQMRSQHQQHKQQRSDRHQLREQHREELLTVLSHEQLYAFEKQMQETRKLHRKHKRQPQAAE